MAFVDDDTHPLEDSSWHDAASNASALDQDRVRLATAFSRDMAGLSDVTGSGEATDTMGSFDISNDALGHSTRRLDQMLNFQTPNIDSRMMRDNFVDFTYANDNQGSAHSSLGSLEIGRGRQKNDDSELHTFDFSSRRPISIGGPDSAQSKKQLGAGRAASISSNTSDLLRSRTSRRAGTPTQNTGAFPNIDFSPPKITPKRPPPSKTRFGSGGSGGSGGGKVTDFVSNSGSGGSRSKFAHVRTQDDSLSDAGSITDRPRPSSSRFAGAKNRKVSADKTVPTRPIDRDQELTAELPHSRTKKSAAIPSGFKSTEDFFKELGFVERTSTLRMQQRLQELKDPGPSRRPSRLFASANHNDETLAPVEPSFVIPQMPDMTELFSGDATRFSRRGVLDTHKPIESIPVPQDERAVLMAMRLLQEKILSLEGSKTSTEQRCVKLERELRRAEVKFQQEQQRAHLVEEELTRRHEDDSAFEGSDNGEGHERAKERARIQLHMEKLKLESNITSLKSRITDLENELDTANISLRNMHEERNAAVNAVAYAISANEDLKISNQELLHQLDQLKLQKDESERLSKAREDKLRRKAREFRDQAAAAEAAVREAAKRDREEREAAEKAAAASRQEQMRKEREAREREERERIEQAREDARLALAKKEFEREVEEKMRSIRPDLFVNRKTPIEVPGSAFKAGKRRIAVPRSRKTRTTSEDTTAELLPFEAYKQPDDTMGPISAEEVRRIATEINRKRKARKDAEIRRTSDVVKAQREAESKATMRKRGSNNPAKPKGRVLKVVTTYVVEGEDGEVEVPAQAEDDLAEIFKKVRIVDQAPLPPVVTESAPLEPEVLPPLPHDDDDDDELEEIPAPSHRPQTAPPPPPATTGLQNFVNHFTDGSHSSTNCTVCVRQKQVQDEMEKREQEDPLADVETAMLEPAPALEPASLRPGADESHATARPSLPPKEQLEKVVRQLRDEYNHLKIAYQEKHSRYVAIEPAVGKKARKMLVREMNDLVAEMETKCDQIYALYDVNEGFVSGEIHGGDTGGVSAGVYGDDTEALIASLQP